MEIKQNTIYITGGTYALLIKALEQWIEAYTDVLNPDFIFQINPVSNNKHIIIADKRLNNKLFFFLVNYIKFPIKIEYNISLKAYTILESHFTGKQAMIYIDENNKESDNVNAVTTDNEVLKFDFGGKSKQINNSDVIFTLPDFKLSDSKHSKIIKPKEKKNYKTNDNTESSASFQLNIIIAICVIILIATAFFSHKYFFFVHPLVFFGYGLLLFNLYKLLQHPKAYKKALVFSVILAIYGIILLLTFHTYEREKFLIFYSSLSPVIFLLYQKPIRLKFIALYGKEPIIEKNNKDSDIIYGLVLLGLTAATLYLLSLVVTLLP